MLRFLKSVSFYGVVEPVGAHCSHPARDPIRAILRIVQECLHGILVNPRSAIARAGSWPTQFHQLKKPATTLVMAGFFNWWS